MMSAALFGNRSRFSSQLRNLLVLVAFVSLSSIQSASAISCYICAPVPEIDATCATVDDLKEEQCPPSDDACHLLVIRHAAGNVETIRNCGRFRGPPQTKSLLDGCTEFSTTNGEHHKACNCLTDRCNSEPVLEGETAATTTVASWQRPTPTREPTKRPQSTAGKLIPDNVVQQTTTPSSSTRTGGSALMTLVVFFGLMVF